MGKTGVLRALLRIVGCVLLPAALRAQSAPVATTPLPSGVSTASPVSASPASGAVAGVAGGDSTPASPGSTSAAAPSTSAGTVSSAATAASAKTGGAGAAGLWRRTEMNFSTRKPVLGLPLNSNRSRPHCATDGTTFFDFSATTATSNGSAAPDLFSVSRSGEMKHLLRKLPIGFDSISARDFFAGEYTRWSRC